MRQTDWDQLMIADGATRASEDRLILRSQIADLALVSPWIERLGLEYNIPASIQFAMNLCLEEALSNIIRHGYRGKPDHQIVVRYVSLKEKSSLLVIDDEAPPFNPLDVKDTPIEETLQGAREGGMGLRLLRSFAATLKYELTPTGNRLSIAFSAAD